jgi:hypothetical protein
MAGLPPLSLSINAVRSLGISALQGGEVQGLVFNDNNNGTLRMDGAQVNDGVPETSQSNASQQNLPEKGQAKAVRVRNFGWLR